GRATGLLWRAVQQPAVQPEPPKAHMVFRLTPQMDVNWLLLVVAGRNDVKESPGFLEKLANRFVPHVGTAKLGANWTSTPLAAISSPPASPAPASAATASRATSACATPGSGAMTGVHDGRPGVAHPSTAPPSPASAVPRVFDDDRACHTDHRLE